MFFIRPDGVAGLCESLSDADLSSRADLVVVVSGAGNCGSVSTVNDPTARLAAAHGLRRPKAGGPPVGYAIVDSRGQIRYRTLDPGVAAELGEVATILRAIP